MSDLIGAIAVVVSLVYLAIQIRQNTHAMRAETAREVVASIRANNTTVACDAELFRIFSIITENPSRLSPEDRGRATHLLFNHFRSIEDAHHQYTKGNLDEDIWAGWSRTFSDYINSPGWREYWELRRDYFSSAFARYVDELDSDRKSIRLNSQFARDTSSEESQGPSDQP
ncbi:MAG: hypothetical protein WBW92_05420 [Rhodanobacteraceae bacterium]